jgi:hypothetical protein
MPEPGPNFKAFAAELENLRGRARRLLSSRSMEPRAFGDYCYALQRQHETVRAMPREDGDPQVLEAAEHELTRLAELLEEMAMSHPLVSSSSDKHRALGATADQEHNAYEAYRAAAQRSQMSLPRAKPVFGWSGAPGLAPRRPRQAPGLVPASTGKPVALEAVPMTPRDLVGITVTFFVIIAITFSVILLENFLDNFK